MEGNLIIVHTNKDEADLEFAKMVFNYPSTILVITEDNKKIQKYAFENTRQVILLSLQEALDLFGPDDIYRMGKEGEKLDIEIVGANLKEGRTVMIIFGDEKPDTTMDRWVSDMAAITIILYDLKKLIGL